ncbi:methanogenesis marker 16 metalloprotein [Desulfospira joergensenii]|uniref:methanogenesis marker 16 metalloprotein n=1 Tax=Desulfospira joergensenii TaxID=53329 RepID=UPI0003B50BED|nr:methanogenesis marker 16 metalloprotein [Desulfospira joergensenii]
MTNSNKTLTDIQKKIDRGDVIILTAREIGDLVRKGKTLTLEDIDVVTTATSALMSGTYAVLSFQVAEPDTFTRAEKVRINSVPAQVGPCPNERIGILDLIVLGTARSEENPGYGGGHLFRDLVRGDQVRVEIETDDGRTLTALTTLKQIPHAVLHASRNAFKNYLAFVNPGKSAVSTIFHSDMMEGDYREMTFCGCGELNPIENDPNLETIGLGTPVLINGAPGMVTGSGTRSTADKPNLTGSADMHTMKPEFMGGFSTGHGPDIMTTWAVAIPVLNREMLTHILKTDDQIPLKVVDIRNRRPIHEITYGQVWQGLDGEIEFNEKECLKCETCAVEEICPVDAVRADPKTGARIDPYECFHCGRCISACQGKAFKGDLGRVRLEGVDHEVPITLRQSNRPAAIRAAADLKEQIRNGQFRLSSPLAKIRFPDSP